jgi:tetratricopeptide (TPR) repeat protein
VGDQALLAEAEERRGVALLLLNRPEEGQQVIEAAIPLIEEVISLIEARGKLDVLRSAFHNAACAAAYLGQVERQRHYAERALRVAERLGNPSQIGFVLANLGHALLILGEWDAARDALDRAVDLAESSEHSVNLAYPLTVRGVLALQEGEWDRAGHLHEEALAMAEETGNRQARDEAERGLAELDLRQGRARHALARLQRQATEDDADVTVLPILARAFLEAGDVGRAEEVAGTAVSRARAQEPLSLVDALSVLGMVRARQGRTEEARDAFCDALDLACRLPSPYLQAQILYEMGWMASRGGERAEGRSRLADALAIFRRLGAQKDAERTAQALARLAAV